MNQHLLSQSEINHYHDEGFLIPQLTLEGSEIEELKHAVDRECLMPIQGFGLSN